MNFQRKKRNLHQSILQITTLFETEETGERISWRQIED